MKLKRVTSLLLILILCASVFCMSAFAEDGPGGSEEGVVVSDTTPVEEVEEEAIEEEVIVDETSYEEAEANLLAAAPEETYTVYVYVAGKNDDGETLSADCLEFLGIDPNTLDKEGYFPIGEIQLKNYLTLKGETVSNVPQDTALITNDEEWAAIVADVTTSLNTGNLEEDYQGNAHNSLTNFISEAIVMYGSTGGDGQSTMLCRKDSAYRGSYGFSNERDYDHLFHLDLCFNTKTITFILGNNGLSNDNTTIESRTYIENCTIQEPNNFTSVIPDHYYWNGKYYVDADFTTEWNGIGTDITEDQTVYIRLVGEDKVGINYEIVDGEGQLSITTESLYKDETAVGCTATPAERYHFVGWYSDAECQVPADEDNVINPATPESGFVTYYAKFEKDVEPEPEPTPSETPTEPSEEPSVTPTPEPEPIIPTPVYPSRPTEPEQEPEVSDDVTIDDEDTPLDDLPDIDEPGDEVTIEEPDTPLDDGSEITETPTTEEPAATEVEVTIEEESVPQGSATTSALPQTGHHWVLASILAIAGFSLLGYGLKRAKDESEEDDEE